MLQNNPFFSSPFIFYGTQQETESEALVFEEKTFLSPTHTFLTQSLSPNHIGLFFLWDEEMDEIEPIQINSLSLF